MNKIIIGYLNTSYVSVKYASYYLFEELGNLNTSYVSVK